MSANGKVNIFVRNGKLVGIPCFEENVVDPSVLRVGRCLSRQGRICLKGDYLPAPREPFGEQIREDSVSEPDFQHTVGFLEIDCGFYGMFEVPRYRLPGGFVQFLVLASWPGKRWHRTSCPPTSTSSGSTVLQMFIT